MLLVIENRAKCFYHLQNVHPTFLRTVSPFYDQAKVWVEILKYYKWKSVLTVVTNDYESKTLLAKFLGLIFDSDIKVSANYFALAVNEICIYSIHY